MGNKEEIYAVLIKGEQRGDITIHDSFFVVGNSVPSMNGKLTTVEKITLGVPMTKIFIYFQDGTRMITGYNPQKVDLFYRPIKEDNGATRSNESNKE